MLLQKRHQVRPCWPVARCSCPRWSLAMRLWEGLRTWECWAWWWASLCMERHCPATWKRLTGNKKSSLSWWSANFSRFFWWFCKSMHNFNPTKLVLWEKLSWEFDESAAATIRHERGAANQILRDAWQNRSWPIGVADSFVQRTLPTPVCLCVLGWISKPCGGKSQLISVFQNRQHLQHWILNVQHWNLCFLF